MVGGQPFWLIKFSAIILLMINVKTCNIGIRLSSASLHYH